MTNDFSFARLLQLINKQWVDNRRMYLFAVLALISGLSLVFLFWVLAGGNSYREENAYIIFMFGLFISGAVFASMSFNMLGDRSKGAYWLGFPASHLEKLLSMIFYNVICFTAVYIFSFLLVEKAAVAYVRSAVEKTGGHFTPMNWEHGFVDVMPYFMYGFFAVQALYMLGSVFFSRYHFILTTIVGGLLIFLFVIFMSKLHTSFLPEGYGMRGWYVTHVTDAMRNSGTYERYGFAPFVENTLAFLVKYMWAPVFWLITWFRLKEKQI